MHQIDLKTSQNSVNFKFTRCILHIAGYVEGTWKFSLKALRFSIFHLIPPNRNGNRTNNRSICSYTLEPLRHEVLNLKFFSQLITFLMQMIVKIFLIVLEYRTHNPTDICTLVPLRLDCYLHEDYSFFFLSIYYFFLTEKS